MFRQEHVKVGGVKPEILMAMILMDQAFKSFDEVFVFTELVAKRSHLSYHPSGYAIHVRKPVKEETDVSKLTAAIRRALGSEYLVVLEVDHIHVEFDLRGMR